MGIAVRMILVVVLCLSGCAGRHAPPRTPPPSSGKVAQKPAGKTGKKSPPKPTSKTAAKAKKKVSGKALAVAPPTPLEGPPLLFWRVSQPGGGTAYFLGSVHLRRNTPPFDPVIEEAFESADTLVVEVDTKEKAADKMQALYAKSMALPRGETLQSRLSPATFQALSAEMERQGLSMQAAMELKPWAVFLLLTVEQFKKLGYASEKGVDQRFLERAYIERPPRRVVSLETADFQLRLFDGFPPDAQEQLLREVLRNPKDMQKNMDTMMDAWESGDPKALEETTFGSLRTEPETAPFYKLMYFDRNLTMAEKLAKLLTEPRTYFVVVGAGHLVGDKGLVALLAHKGYSVKQLHRRPIGD